MEAVAAMENTKAVGVAAAVAVAGAAGEVVVVEAVAAVVMATGVVVAAEGVVAAAVEVAAARARTNRWAAVRAWMANPMTPMFPAAAAARGPRVKAMTHRLR